MSHVFVFFPYVRGVFGVHDARSPSGIATDRSGRPAFGQRAESFRVVSPGWLAVFGEARNLAF